ncbi:hypothetical protein [uncultured Thiodictyon sp.]|uniref:hypothetical protein n=1 Tax=uncultured Thiodictyon sp. TaxID=1846217 RepID=UPI0025E2A3DF|nr:hypothetical protein [uncultured Thiodictyon sp.]
MDELATPQDRCVRENSRWLAIACHFLRQHLVATLLFEIDVTTLEMFTFQIIGNKDPKIAIA